MFKYLLRLLLSLYLFCFISVFACNTVILYVGLASTFMGAYLAPTLGMRVLLIKDIVQMITIRNLNK